MITNKVQFIYENKLIELENPDPNQTILSFIRDKLKKTGTKEGCAEGGCGACTIVLGELENKKIKYKAINSCISFTPTLHGKQLIVVENLVSKDGSYHPVQEAMAKYHASQCGFCTPGFVMSIFAMSKNKKNNNNNDIKDAISGNLCRCTGYRPIIDAAKNNLGIALAWRHLHENDLASGSLIAPFPESVISANGYHLAWPFNASKNNLLDNILDWLITEVNFPSKT